MSVVEKSIEINVKVASKSQVEKAKPVSTRSAYE